MKSGFVIAALSSGSGKTTLTLGLLRALRRRGVSVAPFKCGPDYIDTSFHRVAAGCDSTNLDLFMGSESLCSRLFARESAKAQVSVVEGVMGLFDGYDCDKGSAAHVARTIGLPVVLLVDASSKAYSTAAMIFGFKHFRPDMKIAGVVFNRVASDRHLRLLKQACRDADTELLGAIRRNSALVTPSRHLGLTLTGLDDTERFIEAAADAVEDQVNINRILEVTAMAETTASSEFEYPAMPWRRIAVARDEAFSFIYPENVRVLAGGASPIYFSPLRDKAVPPADMIYLPGGYPELYAEHLAANEPMRRSIRDYCESGRHMIAECGGLLYLCRDIDGADMCGVFPMSATMEGARLHLGYRTVRIGDAEFRGHEFHYSTIKNPDALLSVAVQTDAAGNKVDTPLYRYKNTIAGYTHLYWAETSVGLLFEL